MAEARPIARSPIPLQTPGHVVSGWLVSARVSTASFTLTDCTPMAKVHVRAAWNGQAARRLGVPPGRATRTSYDGVRALVIGSAPGEWLVLGPPGEQRHLSALLTPPPSAELVTVADLTHGRALLRLTGVDTADLLARECSSDLDETARPHGTAWRTLVAGVVTDLVRDDTAGTPSYLLHCDRSLGRYLAETLLDSGASLGIDVDGSDAAAV